MTNNEKGTPWVSAVTLHPRITYSGYKTPTAVEESQMHHAAHEGLLHCEFRQDRSESGNSPQEGGMIHKRHNKDQRKAQKIFVLFRLLFVPFLYVPPTAPASPDSSSAGPTLSGTSLRVLQRTLCSRPDR